MHIQQLIGYVRKKNKSERPVVVLPRQKLICYCRYSYCFMFLSLNLKTHLIRVFNITLREGARFWSFFISLVLLIRSVHRIIIISDSCLFSEICLQYNLTPRLNTIPTLLITIQCKLFVLSVFVPEMSPNLDGRNCIFISSAFKLLANPV